MALSDFRVAESKTTVWVNQENVAAVVTSDQWVAVVLPDGKTVTVYGEPQGMAANAVSAVKGKAGNFIGM